MRYLNLKMYEEIVGRSEIEEILDLADKLKGISVVHINSTRKGGGVAEILQSLVPLFNLVGINCRWEVIEGTERFFQITKLFHNLLQGLVVQGENITQDMLDEYIRVNESNIKKINLISDIVIIHDPQPAPLIEARKNNRWIWRCHIDLSNPDKRIWDFLSTYIKR